MLLIWGQKLRKSCSTKNSTQFLTNYCRSGPLVHHYLMIVAHFHIVRRLDTVFQNPKKSGIWDYILPSLWFFSNLKKWKKVLQQYNVPKTAQLFQCLVHCVLVIKLNLA